jgi:hypothetical protein
MGETAIPGFVLVRCRKSLLALNGHAYRLPSCLLLRALLPRRCAAGEAVIDPKAVIAAAFNLRCNGRLDTLFDDPAQGRPNARRALGCHAPLVVCERVRRAPLPSMLLSP